VVNLLLDSAMNVVYALEPKLDPTEMVDLLRRSTLPSAGRWMSRGPFKA